jgi:hypothetical protein
MPFMIGKMQGNPPKEELDEFRDALVDLVSDAVIEGFKPYKLVLEI